MQNKVVKVGCWDCSQCGRRGNWGYEYNCSGCGKPRGRNVRFYLLPDAPVATKAQQEMMGNDPNWYCLGCDSGNRGSNTACWNCGLPRGQARRHGKQFFGEGQKPPVNGDQAESFVPDAGTDKLHVEDNTQWGIPPEIPPRQRPKQAAYYPSTYSGPSDFGNQASDLIEKFRPYWPKALVGLGITALLVLVYFFFFATRDVSVFASSFSWTRTVNVEELITYHESGWSVPAGGRQTGKEWKQSGWVQVQTGSVSVPYECGGSETYTYSCSQDDGNGGFSTGTCTGSQYVSKTCYRDEPVYRNDPVYDWYYYYDIDRWTTIKQYPTSGNDKNPYYDDVVPPDSPKFRRIEVPGSYTVHFGTEDKIGPFDRQYPFEKWQSIEYGQSFTAVVNSFNVILEVK